MGLGPFDVLLYSITLICIFGSTFIALSYPPTILSQGQAHRIFYFHVPIAWVALYAPIIACVCSILYLSTYKVIYDIYSLASIRVAYIFSLCVLISGPLWAKTEWGTYWNWKDARLISFFTFFVLLNTYFLLRSQTKSPRDQALLGAVMTILTSLASILTWFSIRLIQSDTHPPSVLSSMDPKISLSFWISVISYHLFFLLLLKILIRAEKISFISRES